MSSFYTSGLRPYTSIRAHNPGPVSQIVTNDKAVFSLSPNSIRLSTRRGTTKSVIENPAEFTSLSCLAFGKDTGAELYVGGNPTNELLKLQTDAPGGSAGTNFTRIQLSNSVTQVNNTSPSVVKIVRTTHAIVVGKNNGAIDIIDPNSNLVVRSFHAHGGLISDMDAKETTLLTCGFSSRKTGLLLDPLVNIFDLRAGKPLPPVPFPAGAGFVRLHPKLSTCAFIASQTGQIQLIDFANPASTQVRLHQASLASTGTLSGLDVSPSGDFLALTEGPYIQLWSNQDETAVTNASFNEFSNPMEFPVDPATYTQPISSIAPPSPAYIDIDDENVPLSTVGLPYYKDELLSSWAIEPGMPMIFNEGMPQQRIPMDVLLQVQAAATVSAAGTTDANIDIHLTDPAFGGVGLMGFFPQTPPGDINHSHRRNLAQGYVSFKNLKQRTYSSSPKFISERTSTFRAAPESSGSMYDMSGSPDRELGENPDKNTSATERTVSADASESPGIGFDSIPLSYRKLEIKYSKFGISDFDFEYYNHTTYSGLEPQFSNSYCNPLLQLYRYSQPLCDFSLNYLRHNTLDDKSLLSELGLLFDMLHKAKGQHCAATNFVKTLSAIPQANALGLIIDDAHPSHALSAAVTSVTGGTIGSAQPGGYSFATQQQKQQQESSPAESTQQNSDNRSGTNTNVFASLYGRTFGIPGAGFLGTPLTAPPSLHAEGILLQAFSRFLMERMAIDERAYDKASPEFENIAGIKMETTLRFPLCMTKSTLNTVVYSIELNPLSPLQQQDARREVDLLNAARKQRNLVRLQHKHLRQQNGDPEQGSDNQEEPELDTSANCDIHSPDAFLRILQNSLVRQTSSKNSKAWCENCHAYQTHTTTKTVCKLPEVLNIHIPLSTNYNVASSATTTPASTAPLSAPLHNFSQQPLSATEQGHPQTMDFAESPATSNPLLISQYQSHYAPPAPFHQGPIPASMYQQYPLEQQHTFIPDQMSYNHTAAQQHSHYQSHSQPPPPPPQPQPFWRKSQWPATDFAVRKSPQGSGSDLKIIPAKERGPDDDLYELVGLVVEIKNTVHPTRMDGMPASTSSTSAGHSGLGPASAGPGNGNNDSHLISFINIPVDSKEDVADNAASPSKQWHLFNDFLVKPVPQSEALDFSYSWKTPVVVLYQHVPKTPRAPFNFDKWRSELDTSILYRDHFAPGIRAAFKREYELLDPNTEAPGYGTLVAMDTEFVMLQHEETEIISDGTKSLMRPKELSLARVSVVRGEGPKQGVPFIDDFIATTETIVDYLTEFSGIEPGDLDPWTSKRSGLVTLQTSYKRLWLLLNLGCRFIGHGLYNDFRTINIHVPPHQVVDTLHLFYLPEYKRRLSLKYLAYALLNENVQTGNHDSIEDAVTALRLYNEYLKATSKGPSAFTALLHQLYKEGKKCNFKPPSPGSAQNTVTHPPTSP